jgi:hypothetical protein
MSKPRVDASEAARILGVPRHSILKLVALGMLSASTLPGVRARYLREEVEALAASQWKKSTPAGAA